MISKTFNDFEELIKADLMDIEKLVLQSRLIYFFYFQLQKNPIHRANQVPGQPKWLINP